MKIEIVKYNPDWPIRFGQIRQELQTILAKLNPTIEHIGSTAVPNLSAKPIIDIAIGVEKLEDLDKAVEPMVQNNFIYYEVYNTIMPLRRFFIGLNDKKDNEKFNSIYSTKENLPHEKIDPYKLCHIHIWEHNSKEWIRHIAFRDYLIEHPSIKTQYENLKKQLSLKNWSSGNEYNSGKNDFIKTEEAKAVLWCNKSTSNLIKDGEAIEEETLLNILKHSEEEIESNKPLSMEDVKKQIENWKKR